jgi:DNA invertase Pin-like site-specific DNA recombinase
MMRVALYTRISTSLERQDTTNQLRQLRDFCVKQGWEIVKEYSDAASGKHSARPEFRAMFDAASRHEFDLVFFWSLDRLSREGVLETLHHIQRLTSYGVNYKSYTEQYLDSLGMFRDAVIGILATIAKQERVRLSERTIAGLERAKAQGRVGGRPRVICDRTKILMLRQAGKSLGRIAAELKLAKTTVHRIVENAERSTARLR